MRKGKQLFYNQIGSIWFKFHVLALFNHCELELAANSVGIIPLELSEDIITFRDFCPLYTHYKIHGHICDFILCIYFTLII